MRRSSVGRAQEEHLLEDVLIDLGLNGVLNEEAIYIGLVGLPDPVHSADRLRFCSSTVFRGNQQSVSTFHGTTMPSLNSLEGGLDYEYMRCFDQVEPIAAGSYGE